MKKNTDVIELIPPYCPNSACLFHLGTKSRFYVKNGWTPTDKPPFRNQRYKCKSCKIQFSTNTYSFDFRKKIVGLGERVLDYCVNGMSNNSIARVIGVAEGTVRDRLKTIARQALIFEGENRPKKLSEDVAYDGFETFTHSQFSPCYVNTAVGSFSGFVYHNTLSPLNRKGRMTEEQKSKNEELQAKFGLYPSDSVFQESRYIITNLSKIGAGNTIFTDDHRAYRRAVQSFDCQLQHKTISSKRIRNSSNPLFPVNHLHLLYRHFFSSQHRETIAFQKHEAALIEKMQIMKIHRNFMATKFVKKNKFDRFAHEWSPAMYLGLTERLLNFEDIFRIRKLTTQVNLDEKESAFMNRDYPFSRQKIAK